LACLDVFWRAANMIVPPPSERRLDAT
jgi:hypothetical protein